MAAGLGNHRACGPDARTINLAFVDGAFQAEGRTTEIANACETTQQGIARGFAGGEIQVADITGQ
jgi:hypothetical protein